jgi:hypothetical protein
MADAEYVRHHPLRVRQQKRNRTDQTPSAQNAEEAAELKKKRTFRKFSYRGIDLDQYVFTTPSPRNSRRRSTCSIYILFQPHKLRPALTN